MLNYLQKRVKIKCARMLVIREQAADADARVPNSAEG